MEVKDLIGGDNVSVELVRNSPSKKLVMLSAGAMKKYETKEKLCLLTEIDGKQMMWTPNKTSMKNISQKYGTETTNWIGKAVGLELQFINGKEAVVGKPL